MNKRVGYLLELNGLRLNEIIINNKYDRLNKNLGKAGTRNKKWKLILNEKIH